MNDVAIPATALDERVKFAQLLAKASLLPSAYRDKPANVLLAMEYADALGLSPIAAIQGIHVVDGKPTASAQLIGALIRRAGHRLRVTVAPDGLSARAEIVRTDDPDFTFVSEWTMARAEAAGLTGKGTWKQYSANMLKARAITEVGRDACPEVLAGVPYTPEELGDDTITVDHRATTANWESPAAEAIEFLEATGVVTVEDPNITDAEVVEEVPADLPEHPEPARNLSGPAGRAQARSKATPAQVKRVSDLCYHEKIKPDVLAAFCHDRLGFDIPDHLEDLLAHQASAIIKALTEVKA